MLSTIAPKANSREKRVILMYGPPPAIILVLRPQVATPRESLASSPTRPMKVSWAQWSARMNRQGATLIIGGGGMGSSIAWHLKSDPNFAGQVTVIERDPSYARASSALSASSIRQQFSTPLNIHLSRYGIGFLRRAPEILGVDLGLKEPGYLFLASPAGEAVLRANHAIQRGEGCAVDLLDPAELVRRFPALSAAGVALASHGTANEGWFDGPALMAAFRRKARELGAKY